MKSIFRSLFAAAFLTGALSLAAPAQAQDATPKAFHGVYSGTGIARSKDSFYFGITMRDLDVEIRPADGGGFSVKWTTVLRQGGTPENPDVRKKGTTLTFSPAEGGKLYKGVGRTNAYSEEGLAWARINKRTLTIYIMTISENGKYNLQSYARTISGRGMDLEFTRIKDGETTRSVKAKLVKQAE